MKRFIAFLLLAVMLMVPLAGCAPQESEEPAPQETENQETSTPAEEAEDEIITLKIYAQYSDDDTKVPYDYAVQELAKAYPNVKLELDIQAQDDGQKLQTYAATGKLPDIFQVGLSQITTFKESGNILVLDDYAKSTGFADKVHPSAENILYNEDGHIYAFPYAGNELVIWFYNKAIFEEYGVKVPETYDELLQAIETFNANDVVPMSLFAKEKWPCVSLYDVMATRFDPAGITALDQGQAMASDDAYKMAAEKVEELIKAGLLPNGATNLNYDQAASLFYEGKAAMFLNGQWEIEGSTTKLGDDVDWMYYPTVEGYEGNKYAMAGGGAPGGYAVSPYSEHKDLAAEVAAFISLKYAEAKYLYRSNPLLATEVPADMEPENAFPPMMEKLANELPNLTSTTKFAWGLSNPKFKVAIEDQAQFLLTPGYTAEEFVAEIDKVLERLNK